MNLENRTIQQQAERIKTLETALDAMLRCGEMRAWDHETSTPKQREAMKLAREALPNNQD